MHHLLELGRIFFWKSGEIIKPSTPSYVASFEVLIVFQKSFHGENSGADLGGGCGGCAPPPPEMTCGFLIQLVFCKKTTTTITTTTTKTMWFIGVEVEQETSAPPPKKNPGSAPEIITKSLSSFLHIHTFVFVTKSENFTVTMK